MIYPQHACLDTRVPTRYEVYEGKITTHSRDEELMLYGIPRHEHAYIWEESKERTIVVLRADTRSARLHDYGCFYALPTLDAAIMFARAVTP